MASLHDASFYCITDNELPIDTADTHVNYREVYVKVSISFACLGIFGAVWQLISWRALHKQTTGAERSRRSITPAIAISLAASNFFACFGVIARATGILITSPPNVTFTRRHMDNSTNTPSCIYPDDSVVVSPTVDGDVVIIGTVIEIFTNFMYAASVMWTLAYAVDVFSRIRRRESQHHELPRDIVYHILCWGIPVLTTTAGTLAVWTKSGFPGQCAGGQRLLWRYLFSYLPVLIVLLVNPIIYWRAHAISRKLPRLAGSYSHAEWDVVRMLKFKFLIIVGVYSLCWLPNIADSIVQLTVMASCESWQSRYRLLIPFWLLEAILNPLQGLFNCFLYRRGMFACFRKHQSDEQTIQSSVEEQESRLLLGSSRRKGDKQRLYTIE